MNPQTDFSLSVWTLSLVLALLGAPLLSGIIARVKAFFAGRHGKPFFQLYYDLGKLMLKGVVISRTSSAIFKLAPAVNLTALLMAFLLFPLGAQPSPFAFFGDVLLFVYLLALARMFTVLAAFDVGSSFGGMGGAREITFSALAEAALLGVIAFLVMMSRGGSLSEMLTRIDSEAWELYSAPMPLIFVAFVLVLLTEACRVPADDPNTHLELTMIHEAMILDYSGPDLAVIEYAGALKLWLLISFAVMLILPPAGLPEIYYAPCYFVGVLLGGVLIGFIESVIARFRLIKVTRMIAGALGAAIIAILWVKLFRGGLW